jgi:hypothetical protein
MPLDTVEPTILTISTTQAEDKNSQKDEIVLQYNPDGEEKLEKLTESHDKHDYVTVDVPGMDLAINVSASPGLTGRLTPQERQMVIKEAIHKFPNVWEVTKSQVSYPKGSIHEHPIPTNPGPNLNLKNPEWSRYVKAYHQSPGKQKFLHDYADDLYKHGIIEDADKRCCITPAALAVNFQTRTVP